MFVILVKLPHPAAPPVHPVMLQVTPCAAGSLVTVAEKSWLPPLTTLTAGGETVTEIGTETGGVASVPQPQARASPKSPNAMQVVLLQRLMLLTSSTA